MPVEFQAEQEVFGHTLGREVPAARLERAQANDRGGAATEGRAPGVLRGQDVIEKEPLLVRPDMADEQVRLDRISIEEVLWRLHHPDARIVEQQHRPPQEFLMRHEIGIQYRDEFRRIGLVAKNIQRVVDVACLGMPIVRSRQVMRALALAERFQPRPAPVIQNPNPHPGKPDPERPGDGAREDRLLLVVGCDQNVDARRAGRLFEPAALLGRFAAAVLGPRQGDEADGPANNGESLDRREPPGEEAIELQCEGRQSLGNAPPDVAPSENNADTE